MPSIYQGGQLIVFAWVLLPILPSAFRILLFRLNYTQTIVLNHQNISICTGSTDPTPPVVNRAPGRCGVLQGFLKTAMMNYLALLGWNDGTEQEIYTAEELQEAFAVDRITKSPAVFDKVKLAWMNGQHLRVLPVDEVCHT